MCKRARECSLSSESFLPGGEESALVLTQSKP